MNHNETVRSVYEHHLTALKYAEDKSFTIMATALYGSQNYGLATDSSDFDTKTLVFPTLNALTFKGEMSKVLHADDGLVEVKDFRDMFTMWRKGSLNFLEVLYTPYWEVSGLFTTAWAEIRTYRDIIARAYPRNVLIAMLGNMTSNFRRNTAKALANAYSIFDTAQAYYEGKPLASCLVSPRKEELMAIKQSVMSGAEVLERFRELLEEVEEFAEIVKYDEALAPNEEYVSEVNALQYRIMLDGLRALHF